MSETRKPLGSLASDCECGRRRRVEEESWPGENAHGAPHQSHVRRTGGSVAPPEPDSAWRRFIRLFYYVFCGAGEWATSSISDLPFG